MGKPGQENVTHRRMHISDDLGIPHWTWRAGHLGLREGPKPYVPGIAGQVKMGSMVARQLSLGLGQETFFYYKNHLPRALTVQNGLNTAMLIINQENVPKPLTQASLMRQFTNIGSLSQETLVY